MSSLTISNCPHSSTVESTELGQVVCTDCGVVLESTILVQHSSFDATTTYEARVESGSIGYSQRQFIGKKKRSYRDNTLDTLKRSFRQSCSALKLSDRCFDTVWAQFSSLCEAEEFQVGSRGNAVLASCLFLWIKEHNYATPLDDILNIFQVTHVQFRRALFQYHSKQSQLIHPSQPHIHFPRLAAVLTEDSADRKSLTKLATSALDLSKRSLLDQGRKESPLSVACMWVAYEALTGKKISSKVFKALMSGSENVVEKTVKERYFELIPLCLETGKRLPFLSDLKETNLRLHLKTILSFSNAPVQTDTPSQHPPSFIETENRRQNLEERIRQAKLRLSVIQQYGIELSAKTGTSVSEELPWYEVSSKCDLTDELIEDLLFAGYTEQDILHLKFKKGPGFISAGGLTKSHENQLAVPEADTT